MPELVMPWQASPTMVSESKAALLYGLSLPATVQQKRGSPGTGVAGGALFAMREEDAGI